MPESFTVEVSVKMRWLRLATVLTKAFDRTLGRLLPVGATLVVAGFLVRRCRVVIRSGKRVLSRDRLWARRDGRELIVGYRDQEGEVFGRA